MWIHIIVVLLLATTVVSQDGQVCSNPQHTGYFSFDVLNGRDHLTTLFENLTSKAPTYQVTNSRDSATFNLTNIRVGYWYNDYEQSEVFVSEYTSHLTSGKLTISFFMDYSILGADKAISKGNCSGKVLADSFFFEKSLNIDGGVVSWKSQQVENLSISTIMGLEWSEPKLPYNYKQVIESMLNGYEGNINFKQKMLADLNTAYRSSLEVFLNSEVLLHSSTVVYSYKTINVTFLNLIYDIKLRNDNSFKGLEFKFTFELENFTKNCNNVPTNYSKSYGGLQEYFGLEFMRAAAWYAASKGFFNRKVNNAWDTEVFQFYAGDLANAVNGAGDFPPNAPVVADCQWNNSLINVNIQIRNTTGISVDLPLSCQITVVNQTGKSVNLLAVHFVSSFLVRIDPLSDTLDFVVTDANILSPVFAGDYNVTDYRIATLYLSRVVKTLIGQKAFGSGFPIIHRKYAALNLTSEYLTIYDPSEPS